MELKLLKMDLKAILVLCIQIVSIYPAPLQLQFLQPMQSLQQPMQSLHQPMQSLQQPMHSFQQPMQSLQLPMQSLQHPMELFQQPIPTQVPHESALQQQMLTLQQLQALQMSNTIHSPSMLYLPQPMLILLPDSSIEDNTEDNGKFKTAIESDSADNNLEHSDTEYIDENLDSVIVEAEPNIKGNKLKYQPLRAILLVPNGKFSIGDFIQGIPWLPFEVNVPDSIAWAYNGISSGIAGIISIIGQRLPFRPRPQSESMLKSKDMSLKMFFKQLQMKKKNPMRPVLVLPVDVMMLPFEMMIPMLI